jgi:hypothetical protein
MSLVQELEDLIRRTGSHHDREILTRVLEQLSKSTKSSSWGFHEERKVIRK